MSSIENTTSSLSSIGFFGPLAGVGLHDGYGYAAIRLIEAWQRMGITVDMWDADAPVAFSMGQPPFYERVSGKLNIGYTPWESTEISKSWILNMNTMDEIWTTCTQNQIDFQRVLDVPVRVLHHGIQRPEWPVKKRELNGPLRFLHIGGHAPRKGAQLLYECFKDLFHENNTDVELVLKGYKFDFKPKGKNITVINDTYTHTEMINLYMSCHAMVYPCNGEGFGLIPFQAASTGMVTCVTDWSGPHDYMEKCWPIGSARLTECDYLPHLGLWADPFISDVQYYLLDIYERPTRYFDQAYTKATIRENYWSWDARAKLAVDMLTDSLNRLGR